jgi:hypothetical protein
VLEFRVQGLGFRVEVLGFRVQGLGLKAFKVSGVWSFGFRIFHVKWGGSYKNSLPEP